ncbi:MAG: YggS family pyridoxal phosphate-dependent enzyme [Pirellulaceae bacterium]
MVLPPVTAANNFYYNMWVGQSSDRTPKIGTAGGYPSAVFIQIKTHIHSIMRPTPATQIRDNWLRVQDAVADACQAAGRATTSVTIVGVSKYVGPESVQHLIDAGCQTLGENRPQQLWEKAAWLQEYHPSQSVHWHMIGHLQRNKVARTLPLIECLQSLDSWRLAETVHQSALALGRVVNVLIDVNISRESSKTGCHPEQLPQLMEQLQELSGIRVTGLMAMSSFSSDTATTRHEFAQVRALRDSLAKQFYSDDSNPLPELSMGMSGDFGEAILEGATLVRIGSSLWSGII